MNTELEIYLNQTENVAAVMAQVAADRKAGNNSAKQAKGELVAEVRKLATIASEAGVTAPTAVADFTAAATLAEVPQGTIDVYRGALYGFITLADSGVDIETGGKNNKPVTIAQARDAMEEATTAPEVLEARKEDERLLKLFKARAFGAEVEGSDWTRPSRDQLQAMLDLLAPHPSEVVTTTADGNSTADADTAPKETKRERKAREAREAAKIAWEARLAAVAGEEGNGTENVPAAVAA